MRTKIIAILLFLLEIAGSIGTGIFLYHDVPVPISKTENFYIRGKDANDKNIVTLTTACPLCNDFHNNQRVKLTDEQLEKVKKTGIIMLPWKDVHHSIWSMFYWLTIFIISVLSVACFLFEMLGCYKNYYYISYKCSGCIFKYRCKLYEKVNKIDLNPIILYWYKFWGY